MAIIGKIFANTLASYEEKDLLDADKLRRLTDATYPEALRLLADFGWGDEGGADDILAGRTARLIEFVREYAPSDKVRDVLCAEFVFHNAKAAYKGRVSGADVSRALYGGFGYVEKSVMSGDYSELPAELAECLERLDEKYMTEKPNSREIETEITQARYDYLVKRARGERMLSAYVKSELDLKNLMTLYRCRLLGMGRRELIAMFIKGGSIKQSDALRALEGSDEAFSAFFSDTAYGELFASAGEGADALAELEKGADELLYALTLAGRDNFLSDVPFVNYFVRALLEIKTVRTVLVCIKNGVTGEIKRRMRAIYD